MGNKGWSITEVSFSAGVIRTALSDIGPSFNVASVKGGYCEISATYQSGVLIGEMMRTVLG